MLWPHGAENSGERAADADRSVLADRGARSMPPAGEPTTVREIQFHQLVGIVRRRGRLIFAIAAIGTTLAGVVGLSIPPKYTARAQIVVEPQQAVLIGGQPVDVRP